MAIPNVVHMMWFTGPKSREFSFINLLAVKAAKLVQQPDDLRFYYNVDHPENPYWQEAKQYARFIKYDPRYRWKKEQIEHPQYQADLARLEILLDYGGIYLDTDALLLKSLMPLMNNSCVLGTESDNDTVANAVMLAEPHNPFLQKWLDALPPGLKSEVWAHHAVVLPAELLREDPMDVVRMPKEAFMPFGWQDKFILGPDGEEKLNDSYAVHMWDTIWHEDLKAIDDAYLLRGETAFAHIFQKYAKWKPKICVYAISKNEEQFVPRFCESSKDADLILIADTGSTDNTVELAKSYGCSVPVISVKPWRFDDARNAALALIPPDIDICVSLDLDEELQPGWREEIERVWAPDTTRLRYKFDWGAGIAFYYEKIHARQGYRWWHPCHEYPVPYLINEKYAQTDMLLVIHKPDPTKSRGQYLHLLEMSVKEDPDDPRNAFYYARELSFHGQWERAIAECNRYLALPGANWANERCYAYRVISRCYAEMGDLENALKAARQGVIEAPGTREPWCEIAKITYLQERWAECYGAAKSALAIVNREWVYTVDPEVWGALPHDYASIAAWHLGMGEEALQQARVAAALNPGDQRLQDNVRRIEESMQPQEVVVSEAA